MKYDIRIDMAGKLTIIGSDDSGYLFLAEPLTMKKVEDPAGAFQLTPCLSDSKIIRVNIINGHAAFKG
jgi:hypothetical protein